MSKPIIIQQVRTGRPWGEKLDRVRGKAKVGTAKIEFEEYDHWNGPVEPGRSGEYVRCTAITKSRIDWP